MKKLSGLLALILALLLVCTACGSGGSESKDAAGDDAQSAEEGGSEEEAGGEEKPEEEALPSVTLTDADRGITYELFYPAEGVEVEETQVFGEAAYRFRSEADGCYIEISSSWLSTPTVPSWKDGNDEVSYGSNTGWTEYTSYAAEGYMEGADNGADYTYLLHFKVGKNDDTPAEHAELQELLKSDLVNVVLGSYEVASADIQENEPAEEEEESEVVVDGVAHMKYADVVLPAGWTPVKTEDWQLKFERDEQVPGNVEGDFLTPTLTIETTSSDVPAKEYAETKCADFGGESEVLTGNFGGIDWYYFTPVEDQFYLFTDTSAGTRVDVSGMFFTINDEIEGILSGITVK